ncbi:MAG: T9SS type A sorting domain-containing protein [Candidatus Marinimicrobia bacterium]|nr:T9SS type A sorting domain-containing protein [Candidatus Neomarinimicrobiota bacterium]
MYPNPFNPAATVRYRVPEAGALEIILFNLQGRRVQTLYRGYRQAGEYQLTLRAGHLPSGVYLCRLQSGNCSVAKKLLLLK